MTTWNNQFQHELFHSNLHWFGWLDLWHRLLLHSESLPPKSLFLVLRPCLLRGKSLHWKRLFMFLLRLLLLHGESLSRKSLFFVYLLLIRRSSPIVSTDNGLYSTVNSTQPSRYSTEMLQSRSDSRQFCTGCPPQISALPYCATKQSNICLNNLLCGRHDCVVLRSRDDLVGLDLHCNPWSSNLKTSNIRSTKTMYIQTKYIRLRN